MKAIVVAVVVLVGVAGAEAQTQLDGSAPMSCAIDTVMSCQDPAVCVRGTAQTVYLPPVLTVDVPKKLIGGSRAGRTARITSTGQGQGRLMIAGQDMETLGNMWGLAIDQKTGAMSAAILSHGGGILLFGTCTAL